MKCPSCGLYHPAIYERCIACSTELDSKNVSVKTNSQQQKPRSGESRDTFSRFRFGLTKNQKRVQNERPRLWQIPNIIGAVVAVFILVITAGVTAFFLTRPPDDQRLLDTGKHQLVLGQYAFAVETLNKATALRPDDPNAYLALARAYIGVDQIEKAWDCIMHAQQLGVGVIAEPSLASDLANYYRQRGQYDKAIDLLRPLANASIPGKKGELADLDALKGDECIEKGEFEQAQRAWEEVNELKEGSRYPEAQARLATIYSKLANANYASHEDAKSLDYLNKLNSIGENARNYVMAADILERQGKLKEAVEQVQKALKIAGEDQFLKIRLAQLLARCGKELLGSGEASGYGYLQQASTIDPNLALPVVTLRDLTYKLDASGRARFAGEVFNASENNINSLTMKVQLYDSGLDKVLWSKEEHIIDEYVSALPPQQAKPFVFIAPPFKGRSDLAFKVYLDGGLYEMFPLPTTALAGKKGTKASDTIDYSEDDSLIKKEAVQDTVKEPKDELPKKVSGEKQGEDNISAEEKTMKDLEY